MALQLCQELFAHVYMSCLINGVLCICRVDLDDTLDLHFFERIHLICYSCVSLGCLGDRSSEVNAVQFASISFGRECYLCRI